MSKFLLNQNSDAYLQFLDLLKMCKPHSVGGYSLFSIFIRCSCHAGLAMTPLTAEQISRTCVKFSMSRAWHLGYAVKTAQTQKRCPVQAILDVQNGKLLMSGKVIVDTYIILHIIILISFLVLGARFFTKELEFLMNFIRFNLSSLFLMFLTFNVILYLD